MKRTMISLAAAFAAMMLLPGCGSSPDGGQAAAAPGFDEIVTSRRSVRDYQAGTTISEAEVSTIIQTAQEAPSWANTQTTRYYVALSEDKVAAVKQLIGEGNARSTANAPVMIVSTFVTGRSGFGRGNQVNEIGDGWGAYDNGLSNAYLILKARQMGYDTLIMGMRDSDGLRKIFGIPAEEEVMAVISLGKRASEPRHPEHISLDEVVRFF